MTDRTPKQAPRREADDLVGMVLGERYRIEGRLGRGGAGHVYRAVQENLGREVAIKVLRTDLDAMARREFAARFLREAETAARLRHPNLVTIFDFGTEGDLRYVVMERVTGERLTDFITRGPAPGEDVARIGVGLARGLRHAHAHGVVHRDVKPGNVILEPTEEGVRPVLLDFGLVKPDDDDSQITQVGTYMGTPAYMAPEQAKGTGAADARSDIYSLGCVLFKMLSGEPPYDGKGALAQALAHANDPVPQISARNPDVEVDPGLEAIVRRCLLKNPVDRWPDASALADALEGWAREDAMPPAAASPPGRPWLWIAATGGSMGLAALALLLVGILLGGPASLWSSDPAPPPGEPGPKVAEVPPVPVAEVPEPTEPLEPVEPPDVVEDAPVAAPAPPPRPQPPRPVVSREVVVDGVVFKAAHAARALVFVNEAPEADLRRAGVYGRQVNLILEKRPFADLQTFGNTPQIGAKTVQAVYRGSLK